MFSEFINNLNVHRSDDDEDDDEDGDDHQLSKSRKLSLKKKGIGSEANTERMSRGDVNLQLLNPAEQEKHLKKQRKRSLQGREEEVLFFCFLTATFLVPFHARSCIFIFQLASLLCVSFCS